MDLTVKLASPDAEGVDAFAVISTVSGLGTFLLSVVGIGGGLVVGGLTEGRGAKVDKRIGVILVVGDRGGNGGGVISETA